MKLTCNTIKDILPLAAEDLASDDTVKLIDDHITTCLGCKEEYIKLKSPKIIHNSINRTETIPLESIKRKLKIRNIYVGLLSALIIGLLLVFIINIATKPIPLSYTEAIDSSRIENGKLFIRFNPIVSNYSIDSFGSKHDIMAWKTNVSRFFNHAQAKNTVINIDSEKSTIVSFISQIGELDKIMYGTIDGQGQLSLPRLAMNYYLSAMIVLFVGALFLSFLFKNVVPIKKVLNIIIIFTLSYILGHISIFGGSGTTHHIIRDLYFVIVSCILYFIIIILLLYKDFFLNIGSKNNKKIIQ